MRTDGRGRSRRHAGLWRSSAWRHADGSPATTGPRRHSPGPRTARCLFRYMPSDPWRVERPGRVLTAPRRATGPRRLPRVRQDAMCLGAHGIRPPADGSPATTGPRRSTSHGSDETECRATGRRRFPRVRHDAMCLRAHGIRPVARGVRPSRLTCDENHETLQLIASSGCGHRSRSTYGCGRTGMLPRGGALPAGADWCMNVYLV